jgi:hypothetical protein
MGDIMGWVMSNWATIAVAIPAILGGFATLATLTPNTSDDKIIQKILDIVNMLGLNVGKAKNG